LEVKQEKRIDESSTTKVEIQSVQPPDRRDSLPTGDEEKKKSKRVTILD